MLCEQWATAAVAVGLAITMNTGLHHHTETVHLWGGRIKGGRGQNTAAAAAQLSAVLHYSPGDRNGSSTLVIIDLFMQILPLFAVSNAVVILIRTSSRALHICCTHLRSVCLFLVGILWWTGSAVSVFSHFQKAASVICLEEMGEEMAGRHEQRCHRSLCGFIHWTYWSNCGDCVYSFTQYL